MGYAIVPFEDRRRSKILSLSLRAWRPVFEKLEPALPSYVYRAFYPEGWEARQTQDIEQFLRDEGQRVWVAIEGDAVLGWIGVRLHPKDRLGEIHILAVDPDRQREGVASALLETGFAYMREAGMTIAMVETGDDPGHAASRATYENNGFERWPVARYFREL
jgi:ribosomal protein S18 acetylase RimI-like enzyme